MDVGMQQAKTELSRLVERALAGEEVVLTRRGHPAVRLVPVEDPPTRRLDRARRLAGTMDTGGELGKATARLRDEWD